MKIFARYELVPGRLQPDEGALLLEGAWPTGEEGARRRSLDEWIDARDAWIDDEATRLAEQAADRSSGEMTLAYLNVLPLRYYLVKLLRVVAAFKKSELQGAEWFELHLTRERDEDYADVFGELMGRSSSPLKIHWHGGAAPARNKPPANALWRRLAGQMHCWMQPKTWSDGRDDYGVRRRVVLCGNSRILNPVCSELVRRGASVWWLYDRFAVGTWLRWRRTGVGQLVCNSSLGKSHWFSDGDSASRRISRQIDLTRVVDRWLRRQAREVGAAQSRLSEQVGRHFEEVRPDALVVDEDATPLPRAAVAIGSRLGIPSVVVQHGAPCVQFGFAPLAADRICAWDAGSQRQLERWGVQAEQIVVTGSSQENDLRRLQPGSPRRTRTDGPRLLLLATVPPRDDRPEPAVFHLTRQTYAGMLRTACAAAARISGARLVVKLHPRAQDPAEIRQVVAEFPGLAWEIARGQSLRQSLENCDCVLSCVSSSGVEAAAMGIPVVQLLPVGCGDILPAEDYGFVGSARTTEELSFLLETALSHPHRCVAEVNSSSAVERIVDVVLGGNAREKVIDSNPAETIAFLSAD